ncbi:cysteine hydrolase family protein [Sporosarcina pasteurii]|uniref:Peroxyureidoacrylate/ureidoacrylate amidohydrolase RutB n=1 Tax=Sporosarcina pasteurii TaxID=1474 RepID=A0A380C0X3_SPOPA|nr:isochorismatase family cysteine hydrolase [Sporosarcina pasteurii]MDS9471532.1 isochorismatase family cysteine hydrolase [Sporosarcina pasteurii]QBQ04851.1 cysteine hydrolase [Sporosarcina pasteurii]SUJ10683.1 Peroxyureidoacrylate/ureidoacrylate amidohydrolase RutB [Sporosarcina pasteurii]
MDVKNTALLLIDLQKEGGTSDVVGMDGIIEKTASLIEQCRQKGIPVIYTRHLNRGDGIALGNREPVNEKGEPLYYHTGTDAIEIMDEIKPEPGDIIVDKYRYSCFHESSLDLMLKSLGIKHLIIGGVLTDVCVISTAMDAYYRDYQINLVKDICGTTTEGAHMAAILMMANWVYDIEIYDANQLSNKLSGEDYKVWKSEGPDELQFTPENLREVFGRLTVE